MIIHHLSSTDSMEGAARGAYRVHRGLESLGHESIFLTSRKATTDPTVRQIFASRETRKWLRRWNRHVTQRSFRHFQEGPPTYTFWSSPRSSYRPSDFSVLPIPEIYNLHWVAGFLDWPTLLPWLANRAPIVWTLRDLNPLQGVWHYRPDDIERTPERDRFDKAAFEIKRAALKNVPDNRLSLIASSKWMESQMRSSELFGRFNVRHIPHSLETDVFRPIDKQIARAALQLEDERAYWIGFVAGDVNDPRKGLSHLHAALKKVRTDFPVRILSVGGSDKSISSISNEGFFHFGKINNDKILSLFYSAIDLFVCPSLQEAFGQTVFESMSCGTPVIGFNTGGIPDMVRPGKTGWLVPVGDGVSLAETIRLALSDPSNLHTMGQGCRTIAVDEYSPRIQAQRYIDFFQETISLNR